MSAVAEFTTAEIRQRPASLITIGGIPTPADTWRTGHGIDQPIGTASITVPLTGDLAHLDLNESLEIQAGYRDTGAERIFLGRITDIQHRASISGKTLRIQAEDETSRLRDMLEDEVRFSGATEVRELFRAFADRRAVQLYEAERVLTPNGQTEIALGGVAEVDDGDVLLRRRASPLTFLTSTAKLFGYRVFGIPRGVTMLQRVSGQPSGDPVATFTEGVDIVEVDGTRTTRTIRTNWTVTGASYTDADGVPITIEAKPLVVPPQPYVAPRLFVSGDESSSLLVTQALAEAVREVMEIDYSEPGETVTWRTWGRPEIQPGDVISIRAAGGGIDQRSLRWVTSVRHERTRSGFVTTLSAWSGSGVPLPAGPVEEIIPIGSGPYRMGDEYLPHYVIPSGGGREQVVVPFSVPKHYTSLALIGRQHGTNSYLIDGTNAEATVSKLEVWQNDERVGSATLPMAPENLTAAYDYMQDQFWEGFRMHIPGQLEPGTAELHIISGRDNRAAAQFALDDFELKDLAVEARGVGRPILPGVAA